MKTIFIGEELSNYIEGLQYDYDNLADLLLRANVRGSDASLVDYWTTKYLEIGRELTLAKGEVNKQYIIPYFGDSAAEWNLDFETHELKVSLKEDCK